MRCRRWSRALLECRDAKYTVVGRRKQVRENVVPAAVRGKSGLEDNPANAIRGGRSTVVGCDLSRELHAVAGKNTGRQRTRDRGIAGPDAHEGAIDRTVAVFAPPPAHAALLVHSQF